MGTRLIARVGVSAQCEWLEIVKTVVSVHIDLGIPVESLTA